LAVAAILLAAGFPVALPMGLHDWDLVVQLPEGWATVQVKSALTRKNRPNTPHKYLDPRSGGRVTRADFTIAYDPDTQDYWVFPLRDLPGNKALDPALPNYRNLSCLSVPSRCIACRVLETP
jgi:hypothetical protein